MTNTRALHEAAASKDRLSALELFLILRMLQRGGGRSGTPRTLPAEKGRAHSPEASDAVLFLRAQPRRRLFSYREDFDDARFRPDPAVAIIASSSSSMASRDDEREYSIAAHMLHTLRVGSIQLMTNNPKKVEELVRYGVRVAGRLPHVIPPNDFNRFYLETKREKSGHILDSLGKPHMQEQGEPVQVESGLE